MWIDVNRRRLSSACLLSLVFAASAAASTAKPVSWATPQIRAVTAAGLLGTDVASFRAADPLTAQALENLVFSLKARLAPPVDDWVDPQRATPAPPVTTTTTPITTTTVGTTTTTIGTTTTTTPTTTTATVPSGPKQVASPDRPVTIAQLDARLVGALGLSKAATTFTKNARLAGLKVPARFGAEVVARLLGLRLNHPAQDDSLELLPGDPATRAETAYSVAQILRFKGWETDFVEEAAASFELPELNAWQTKVLNTAVRFIGYPYVWGGTSEKAESPFGVQAHGGFDCSGFVWRVYKLQAYPGAAALASTLKGRTTYQMSGEVPASKRIGFAKLAPGDVLFFGPSGPRSKPASIGHTGIYLGGGWMIHSSGQGVALTPLTGWYRQEFAWARRPLAEAGLLTAH